MCLQLDFCGVVCLVGIKRVQTEIEITGLSETQLQTPLLFGDKAGFKATKGVEVEVGNKPILSWRWLFEKLPSPNFQKFGSCCRV